ncbi:glycosyltransferase 87 family protein [Streptomyces sp. NPDC048664]|uniref:glycosyltransferase 87 family protein n=1 Tax=Streptomyces sp. NPDC048664 TaxID=3154505 RepID=UPI00343F675A
MRLPTTDKGKLRLVLCLVTAVTVFTATVPLLRGWFDVRVYHGAIDDWMNHGGHLYDYQRPGTPYGFTYPPFAALSMLPMAFVGENTAIVGALVLNLAALSVVLWILFGPRLRRHGWFGWALAVCALALFEPLRDTFSFGQVNLLLLALVLTDAWLLSTGRDRRAGVGIGLAAAIKLTPAVFIALLLLARRWRAAALATAVAAAATLLAHWAVPGPSHYYWTQAVWDTTRVGRLDYVSNQSLQGVIARLAAPGEPDRTAWELAVLAVLAVWGLRARRALRAGDWLSAFALTGLTSCLISPITWVHHLVWLLPSFAVLVRERRLRVAGALYAVMCTSVVWLWFDDASGIGGFLGSNTYVWVTLGLLCGLPAGQSRADRLRLPQSRWPTAASTPTPAPTEAASTPGESRPTVPAARTGVTLGGAVGRERAASGCTGESDPTGLTRPTAPNPQSSSERASS